jgi:hypothetical protein
MLDMMEPFVPWATKAFRDYVLNGSSLSRAELEAIKLLMQEHVVYVEDERGSEEQIKIAATDMMKKAGASNREITEFIKKLL